MTKEVYEQCQLPILRAFNISNVEKLEEYEIKSISNIFYKKSASMEQDEIKQYLLKKGYKSENINKAIEEQ